MILLVRFLIELTLMEKLISIILQTDSKHPKERLTNPCDYPFLTFIKELEVQISASRVELRRVMCVIMTKSLCVQQKSKPSLKQLLSMKCPYKWLLRVIKCPLHCLELIPTTFPSVFYSAIISIPLLWQQK